MTRKKGENDDDRLTDDIDFLIWGKLIFISDRDDIDKECDEGDQIDMTEDKKSDERDKL